MYYREQKVLTFKMPLTSGSTPKPPQAGAVEDGPDRRDRQSSLKFIFEPGPGRKYLSTWPVLQYTKKCPTTTSLNWHKVDIYNDREWQVEYKFENYRDFNVNSATVTYSFFR